MIFKHLNLCLFLLLSFCFALLYILCMLKGIDEYALPLQMIFSGNAVIEPLVQWYQYTSAIHICTSVQYLFQMLPLLVTLCLLMFLLLQL